MPLPGFVAYLGDLYTLEGDTAAAQNQYDTVGFIRELEERQQVLYNRQMAVFYANHNTEIDLALTYAEKELKARQDIYAYDTLAWAGRSTATAATTRLAPPVTRLWPWAPTTPCSITTPA